MRYSFCFRPFDVRNIRFAAIYRQNVMKRLKMGRKAKKWDEWNKFLAKKTKEKATY